MLYKNITDSKLMHSTKYIYTHTQSQMWGGAWTTWPEQHGSDFISFLGFGECIRRSRISSLSSSSLSPLGRHTVKATSSIGTPRQPRYSWRQAVGILDLPTQHRAADRTALLRRHLLASLNPRAPWRCEATVWGVICPAAPGLGAQPALNG